ncbi:exo-alpha-sialidase [Blastopirellula sp. J2-11]|uniref:exo-alpha-sialidase n=1 Tax=Blastopirellula sp. J2-11 TaxID=2943192 RepID=UPI0021C90D36|nr:exo-alpha-sialidase [Blastopirellula sp. J2-11]UUO07749.1 exo-alpha-sialidase [Blastopirellula sp. J2-11]
MYFFKPISFAVDRLPLVLAFCVLTCQVSLAEEETPKADSPVMLVGDWTPDNPHDIDFRKLPVVPSEHATISDVRVQKGVHQHNYLVFHNGQYWAMWSDGPGVEDLVGQRVSYATSKDGMNWTKPKYLTPEPPGSGPGTPHYGKWSQHGFRWISRGFWQRDGELLALASLDESGSFFGPSLELRAFRWEEAQQDWADIGVVHDNAINNFPPKRIPSGEWMMSRRTFDYSRRGVDFLTGGVKAIDKWESFPVLGTSEALAAEEPYWWVLPDNRLAALFRDNRQSGYLYRSFSEDNGRTWSRPIKTNFPDARSKFSGVRLKDGRYVLVSNPHPTRRDPLAISISDDGVVFNKMGYLTGGRHVDYPHVIEHDGVLMVAFAGQKQTVEVLKIRLEDLNALQMPSSPLKKDPPYQPGENDVIIDANQQDQVTVKGGWEKSQIAEDRHGEDYLYMHPRLSGSVRFELKPPKAGDYEVFAIWNSRGSRSNWVPYEITHADGKSKVHTNQNADGGTWYSLGTFPLTPDQSAVEIQVSQPGRYVVVDAILISPR